MILSRPAASLGHPLFSSHKYSSLIKGTLPFILRLRGSHLSIASLLYSGGNRLMEAVRLRG